MFAVNQFIEYRYNTKVFQTPCDACKEIVNKKMPERVACIDNCLIAKITVYPQPNGDLKDNLGNCYNSEYIKVKCKDTGIIEGYNITFNTS